MTDDTTRRDRLIAVLRQPGVRGHHFRTADGSDGGYRMHDADELADAIIAADPSLFDDGALRAALEDVYHYFDPTRSDVRSIDEHEEVAAILLGLLNGPLAASPAPAGLDEMPEWLEKALDVGVYPKSSPDGDRTPWQEGFNAAVIQIAERVEAAWAARSGTLHPYETPEGGNEPAATD